MKHFPFFVITFMFLLLIVGCHDVNNSDSYDTNTPNINSGAPSTNSESSPQGTTETFTYGNFSVEISNVCAIRTDTGVLDNGEPYEFPVYICYPGATLSVVNADMSDPTYAEDHKAHPQWGLYDFETDGKIRLTDETEPIVLDGTTDLIFSLESSVGVLVFEFTE